MLLAVDVGNTNIVLGAFDEGRLIQNWRMETIVSRSADEYGMLISQLFAHDDLKTEDVSDIIISSVVPSTVYTFQHLASRYFDKKPLIVGPGIKTGLAIKYDNPGQVGADRIVNAVGALTKYGGPLVIIDLGTATTFCAVTDKWEYLGGSIAQGLKISSEALFEKTAKLPRVELEAPGLTICRNTSESMQAGLVYGHMGTIEFITAKMKKELAEICGADKEVKVVATGGVAALMDSGLECIDHVDKMLTLEGLYCIYEKNRK